MGKVCAALNVADTDAALAAMRKAKAAGADLVELRLDLMEDFDLGRMLDYRPLPAIVTYRRKDQGGGRDCEESERLAVLSRALELGAEYVDLEAGSEAGLKRSGRGRVIVSHHDFEGFPADLGAVYDDLASREADVVKIAVTAEHPLDCLPLYDLCRRSKKPLIALAMGECGTASRVLSLRFGAFLSYASSPAGKGTAPGQIDVAEMTGVYRAGEIGDATRLFGVIGDPIGHSLSPVVHNAAYRKMGMDAVYVSFRVPDRPAEFLRRYAELGFEGFSVTIPHKRAALEEADEVDEVTGQIGAANTITVVGEQLRASNTDADAAVAQLVAAFDGAERLKGRTVLLLGAGGAARAAGWGLVRSGVKLVVANRTEERGRKLAEELGAEFRPLGELSGLSWDAAVNATPLGMSPLVSNTPLAEELIRPGTVVFDTVYNPLRTRLLREAKNRGARPVDGIGMFVEQAAQQIMTWTGQRAWPRLMRDAALERLGEE
ncbi:MAG: shikimate dehydrogenase [Planctomycetota bacterium]|jgi:3-dehydroquinate dehydratase/shikimate dehydrogenase